MGNCQATEAATVVIQHPGGRIERLYWATSAEEVMRRNPGHYVALVTFCISSTQEKQQRFTRVKLLKPKDTLLLGQVYRLITSQEVNKALRARKHEKIRKAQSELIKKQNKSQIDSQNTDQVGKEEEEEGRERQKSTSLAGKANRQWRPSLQSISEVGG